MVGSSPGIYVSILEGRDYGEPFTREHRDLLCADDEDLAIIGDGTLVREHWAIFTQSHFERRVLVALSNPDTSPNDVDMTASLPTILVALKKS